MAEKRANLGASVRAKLLNQARASGQPFDLILVRFALERLLYRLSISGHAERFVLKGAMLLTTWFDDPARPTRDLDLLGFGDPDPDAMQATFHDILSIEVDDGILFNADALRVDRIREALDYGGVRLRAVADVGGARVPVAIDVGFGDALEPGAELLEYPTLLDQPAPKLRAYARETVIAEKFQAMVALGRANSRMKDFYDIWLLATTFAFEDVSFRMLSHPISAQIPRRCSSGRRSSAILAQIQAAWPMCALLSLPSLAQELKQRARYDRFAHFTCRRRETRQQNLVTVLAEIARLPAHVRSVRGGPDVRLSDRGRSGRRGDDGCRQPGDMEKLRERSIAKLDARRRARSHRDLDRHVARRAISPRCRTRALPARRADKARADAKQGALTEYFARMPGVPRRSWPVSAGLWDWEHAERQQQILALSRAAAHPGFVELDIGRCCPDPHQSCQPA